MRLYRSTCSIQLCLLTTLLAVNIGQAVAGFAEDALAKHNELRAKHGAPAMTLDPKLNKEAQQWADKLASTNEFKHSKKSGLGENLYASMGMAVDGATAVDAWYKEICMYDFTKPDFSSSTGHFTIVVWKGSTQLGMASAKSSDGTTYVVANYSPQGNFGGQFAANVLPDSSKTDVKSTDLCKQSTTTSPQGGKTYYVPVGRTLSSDDEKRLQACVSTLGTVKTEKIPGTLILLSKEPTSDDQKKIAICVSNLGSSGNTGVVSSDDKNKLMLNCLTNENLSASITPEGKLDVPGNQTDSERKINKCLPVILGPNVVTVEVNKVLSHAEQNSVIACFKKPGKSVNYGFRVFDNKKTFVSIASPEGSTFVEKLKKDCVV